MHGMLEGDTQLSRGAVSVEAPHYQDVAVWAMLKCVVKTRHH